jgi:hypothetical protein
MTIQVNNNGILIDGKLYQVKITRNDESKVIDNTYQNALKINALVASLFNTATENSSTGIKIEPTKASLIIKDNGKTNARQADNVLSLGSELKKIKTNSPKILNEVNTVSDAALKILELYNVLYDNTQISNSTIVELNTPKKNEIKEREKEDKKTPYTKKEEELMDTAIKKAKTKLDENTTQSHSKLQRFHKFSKGISEKFSKVTNYIFKLLEKISPTYSKANAPLEYFSKSETPATPTQNNVQYEMVGSENFVNKIKKIFSCFRKNSEEDSLEIEEKVTSKTKNPEKKDSDEMKKNLVIEGNANEEKPSQIKDSPPFQISNEKNIDPSNLPKPPIYKRLFSKLPKFSLKRLFNPLKKLFGKKEIEIFEKDIIL